MRELLRRYRPSVLLTPFNVDNTRRRPAPRGLRTFVPLDRWFERRWETEAPAGGPARARNHPPAELAIEGSVPDVMDFVVETRSFGPP